MKFSVPEFKMRTGCVPESPATQVPVQAVVPGQRTQIDVTMSVPVKVAQRNARSIQQVLIVQPCSLIKLVLKIDLKSPVIQKSKPRPSVSGCSQPEFFNNNPALIVGTQVFPWKQETENEKHQVNVVP
jgi:hypothetical protein